MEEVIKLDTIVVNNSSEIPKIFKGFQQIKENEFSGMFVDPQNETFLGSILF